VVNRHPHQRTAATILVTEDPVRRRPACGTLWGPDSRWPLCRAQGPAR